MSTTLEATRLLMLALCFASIPLALLLERMCPRSLDLRRYRTTAGFNGPPSTHGLVRPLLIHVPFVLAVTILTVYLVFVLVSNTL